jgi:hypothetical protein
MQLTRAADYTIPVMIELAAYFLGTRASRAELVLACDCPEFLSKVLHSACLGTVGSHRRRCIRPEWGSRESGYEKC